ncbi:nesprin-2-like [Eucyclogobius newberryi]|uniref:nesprin-2-like n=1 Tax=Eucyclogobius newberryi TaxID=166745 RepID=UPI003B5CCA17
MQTEALRRQSFEQRCESWMSFLQKMEERLAVDVAGSYQGLRQQLCTHKRFTAELSVGHQILNSVISEALHLLHRGEVDQRDDFLLKLAALRQHWQGALERADQRRALIEGLVRHWRLYQRTIRKLRHFLSQTRTLLPPAGPTHCSLLELRRSLLLLQHTEVKFQQYQSSFVHTLEVGRQLFSMGDQDTQATLQTELATLQHEWDSLHALLGKRLDLTGAIIRNWERCEAGLTNSALRLKDVKTRLNRSLPESDEAELQREELIVQGTEDLMEDWAGSLSHLRTMKTDLSQFIIAEDELLLQEQVEFLHCQWDELCVKVSLRKQEIADRLNAWVIFKEKNRELCEWLTQMEKKVSHSSDLNIEEMVEKLKKDCMEEINLFSENKTHLKKLGEQLIIASNKTKENEVNDKLKDVNDRWQHLFHHIQSRVCKLKETLVTVQQLDKNMSNLRTWLSRIEADLSKPVVYSVCHSEEVQRRLKEQQELQRDIEQHTDSVASVLTLCDVLLHDVDACSGDSESDSFQQTAASLDRRWRNICATSMERRMRIEETWRLWCKFLDDYSRFEDWLKSAELTAANPESENVLYTCAKEELKKFEAFQRQVHERLTQLELVNKQYRRLAREQRTDAAAQLKLMVQDGNQRWDGLQRRVYAVIRRLKHFTSQREDFEGTRENILVWLTEMDLQLTNVEHFSESDVQEKMWQLNGFQQEIMLNTNKIDALIVFGENLIQKSAPLDAALMEDELEELHSYCQEVFGRVARFHHRLMHRRPTLDDLSDSDLDGSPDPSRGLSWSETKRRRRRKREEGAGPQCHLLALPLERSGRETPVSVDSIPLEWDHTVDVGGSSSYEDEDDATFFSALSEKSINELHVWLQNQSLKHQMLQCLSPPPGRSAPCRQEQGYVRLMSECSGSLDQVNQVKLILNDEEDLHDNGLTHSTAHKHTHTGVIERWELQAQTQSTDVTPDQPPRHKLTSDLCDVTSWLARVLPELDQLQHLCPSTSIKDLEDNICKLKEMQRLFCSYKCLMISVNLSCRHLNSSDALELQEAVDSANHSWAQACSSLEGWELRLHRGLCKCQEFHESLHALLLWLSQCESRLFSVNLRDRALSRGALLQHRDTLTSVQEELHSREFQVSSLQALSSELLMDSSSDEGLEAKEKVHVIHNKLRLLLRQAQSDANALDARLGTTETRLGTTETRLESSSSLGSEVDGVELRSLSTLDRSHQEASGLQALEDTNSSSRRALCRDPSAPRRPFLLRVLRAAFPLQLLLLLLLVLACLVPLSEDQFSCSASNNFARSFYPMLRYTNGPPPT